MPLIAPKKINVGSWVIGLVVEIMNDLLLSKVVAIEDDCKSHETATCSCRRLSIVGGASGALLGKTPNISRFNQEKNHDNMKS